MKKGTELKSRLALVLKKDDLARIKVVDEEKILVDLHNLGTKEAMILVNNIINLNRNECEISVIHGYNHGIALKDMINNRFKNSRIVARKSVVGNEGMTVLACKSVY